MPCSIPVLGQVHAVVGERPAGSAMPTFVGTGRRSAVAALRRPSASIASAIELQRSCSVASGSVTLPACLERRRREQHDARVRRLQRVEQLLQPLLELRQPVLALERLVGAVADEDHRRLQSSVSDHEPLEALPALSKPAAGLAEDGVAAPAEVAER